MRSKRQTTMAKLNRERAVKERREKKREKKEAKAAAKAEGLFAEGLPVEPESEHVDGVDGAEGASAEAAEAAADEPARTSTI
jgi:hypothetical protein